MPGLRESTNEAEGFVYVSDVDLDFEPDPDDEVGRRPPVCRRDDPPKFVARRKRLDAKIRGPSAPAPAPVPSPLPVNVDDGMATPLPPRPEDPSASSPTGSELNAICQIRTAELFPKRALETEVPGLSVPYAPICGEAVRYLGPTQDGVLSLSNYRIFHRPAKGPPANVLLMLVESADVRDMFYLHIMCKDARSLRCTFETGEQCTEWQRRINAALQPPDAIERFFAFSYKAWAAEPGGEEVVERLGAFPADPCRPAADPHGDFRREVARLQFDLDETWRISEVNLDYQLCPSYPPLLLVPKSVTDQDLETVARFRSSRRIPAVVWRHKGNGAVIARCSQPEVGWLGWRSNEDERLVAALAETCGGGDGAGSRNLLIVDARSYASAVTNRARGGGCECPQYYPCAEIQFMCLPNIHSVRKSFQALRALAAEPPDHANWLSVLEKSLWLQSVGGLLRVAGDIARNVHLCGRPTLVHCSDGWDRTPQIVATAQMLLDPYYRTCEGFRVLVEREWLDFGHKFADRCGHTVNTEDLNERCPVFLQWLDCVHQILAQYPCAFEFSQAYLIKLAQHAYSCLFGTFLCNNRREREHHRVAERTFSVWNFLRGPDYLNHLYEPTRDVMYPSHSARMLVVWSAVYLGVSPDTPAFSQPPLSPPTPAHTSPTGGQSTNGALTKTRSYQDLSSLLNTSNTYRRSSDPNILADALKRSSISLSNVNKDSSSNNNNSNRQLNDDDSSVDINILEKDKFQQNHFENVKHMSPVNSDVISINTTIPKQNINGYSCKINGNVPISNDTDDVDDLSVKDSNCNSKHTETETDSFNKNFEYADIYENGNVSLNESLVTVDSPDRTDGKDYIEQAIDTIAEPHRIFANDDLPSKPGVISGSPMEESVVFYPNIELSDNLIGRHKSERSNWRSESECSQQTDSSCIDLGYDFDDSIGIGRINSSRRQRLDSVQNGGLNDTAANLLETEIGNLISAEKANVSLEQFNSTPAPFEGHRRHKSEGANTFPQHSSLPLTSEPADMTLCPNSPLRAFHRTHSVGAASNLKSNFIHSQNCTSELAGLSNDGRLDSCCLNNLHQHDCHGCTATHNHCLLHCLTHCTHSSQSSGNYNIGNSVSRLDPVDGLVCPQSPVQHRLHQIIQDHKMREEALRKELRVARMELQMRASRSARPTPDHMISDELPESTDLSDILQKKNIFNADNYNKYDAFFDDIFKQEYNPQSDSVTNIGDSSNGSSNIVGNNLSMDFVNSTTRSLNSLVNGNNRVLWVPDHAVSRCTKCETLFWLGRRKHHCRSCGRIFCAECSEKTLPIPNERLFDPVRVCTDCYSSLISSLSNKRNFISEQSTLRPSQIGIKTRQSPVTSSTHTSSAELRPLSDYCKQVSSDQKLNTSPVTAASN